jgi:hypothetical protein
VGDDEGGAALHDLLQRQLQLLLGGGVEGGGRLVEDEDGRVLEERAGDGEALPLAAGERAAALGHLGVEAVRLALEEVERLGPLAGLPDLLVGRLRPADLRFSLMVRANSIGSWKTTPMLRRSETGRCRGCRGRR